MTLNLTTQQVQYIIRRLSKESVIDFMADDVEKSVDWICEFIKQYVDSAALQEKIKDSFPPIQLEIFNS